MSNILRALINLRSINAITIKQSSTSSIRINSIGESLEFFVRDLFAGTIETKSYTDKVNKYEEVFSYLGNQNNPPDIMIKNGDAIEIKKIQSINSSIALNSSYPKNKLYSNDPLITSTCRSCEKWDKKDLIYVIGVIAKEKLTTLWFVYGNCYAASNETYERVKTALSRGVNQLEGMTFSKTNELGRINKVDPLGITNLRIRGMWMIENPIKVFKNITSLENNKVTVNALMLEEKYNSFPVADRQEIDLLRSKDFSIENVKIMSPDNPAKTLQATLIRFTK